MKTLRRPPCRPRSAALALALLLAVVAGAQRPAHYERPRAAIDHARDLFDKAQYTAAQYELDRIAEATRDAKAPVRIEAEFLSALSAVRLFHQDAPVRLLRFMDEHPEDPHVAAVRFELFRHYFTSKRWTDCLAWAVQVDATALGAADAEEFHFKHGYAHFQEGHTEHALTAFGRVKDGTGPYAVPARYYTAHIDYERGRYATALPVFEQLRDDPSFGRIVPFYIAEIHFMQGHYDEVIAYTKPLLEDPEGTKRIGEINRLAGEAHYRTGRYAEAVPYLEKAIARGAGVGRTERYQLGHAYYKAGDHQKALSQFTLVTTEDDSLSQLAVYHMADCYLALKEKNYARNAFKRAYQLGFDARITEDALFNYAKLAYELSFDPYSEAIIALRDYLKKYPDTPRRDEAYGFLVDVFLKSRNYEAALEALDEIRDKDTRLKSTYQRLAHDRGVELYDGRRYADAAKAFQRALKFPMDPVVNARCHYWMGESYSGAGEQEQALRKYDDLRNSPGAYATDLYEQASYSMGYAYFKLKQYDESLTAFRRYTAAPRTDAKQRADALLRIGDLYYLAKDEEQAVAYYDQAIKAGTVDKDYALYQKGVCLGLDQKFTEKIAVLRSLLTDRPNSRFAADAKFQLAETYINLDKDADALGYYEQVVQQHPHSPHVRQSMLQSALVHKRQGDADRALQAFKAIVAQYPTVEGSRDALAGIESIYVEQGKVGEYETYLRSLNFVDPASLDLDEKYYRSAEALYFDDKCDQAIGAFGDYLAKYPQGAFAIHARYYRGDCAYRAKRYTEALPDLEAVAAAGTPDLLESALFGASDILFREQRWEGALQHFTRLEQVAAIPQNVLAAKVGRMRCLRELGRPDDAAQAAEKVLLEPGISADLKAEAGLLAAARALNTNELDKAYTAYKAVAQASTNAFGAEARYHMAYVRFMQQRGRDAEQEVFQLVQKYPSYEHWKARGFILLGDVYMQLNDPFQAKATLQSVIDHVQDPALVQQARTRLDAILASEVQQTTPAPQDDIEVPVNDSHPNAEEE
ncbi:MAG: tetratricopeptide repeat protein [Flavobacteriales bacterium]|nr:tetratricopeptide repeat protein [Flavobacteriales bacterium]